VIARMMTIAHDRLSKDDAVTMATIDAAVPALVRARELFDPPRQWSGIESAPTSRPFQLLD
jgi:hypothetical protein